MKISPATPNKSAALSLRRALITFFLLTVVYLVSFAINSQSGGYWGNPERDGRDRWSFGLSMHTAMLWQPRYGYWAPYRSDWLGKFYSPLIRLDRRFLHPTQYLSDPSFNSWEKGSNLSDWHPLFQHEYLARRAKEGRAGKEKAK